MLRFAKKRGGAARRGGASALSAMPSSPLSPEAFLALSDGLYAVPIILGSCVTLAACVLVLASYQRLEELRRHPASLVALRMLLDAALARLLIVEQSSRIAGASTAPGGPANNASCSAYSFFFQTLLVASELSFLALSHDLYVALRDPFVDYKANKRRYIAGIVVVSLTMAAVLVGLKRAWPGAEVKAAAAAVTATAAAAAAGGASSSA